MNFKQWFSKYVEQMDGSPDPVQLAQEAWDACKEEVEKIIFLNTKQNGKKSIDIEKTIKEIEAL